MPSRSFQCLNVPVSGLKVLIEVFVNLAFDACLERREKEPEIDAQDNVVSAQGQFPRNPRSRELHNLSLPRIVEIKFLLEFRSHMLSGSARFQPCFPVFSTYDDVAHGPSPLGEAFTFNW